MNVVLTCSICLSSAPSAKKFTMQQYLKRQRHLLHGMESRVLKYIPKVDVKLIENKTFSCLTTFLIRLPLYEETVSWDCKVVRN